MSNAKTFSDRILLDILRELKLLNKNMTNANRIILSWKTHDKHYHEDTKKELKGIREK